MSAGRAPSTRRTVSQTTASATTPSSGVTSQAAPARIPSASSTAPPGGYFEWTQLSRMTWSTHSQAAWAGAGAFSRPRANSSACR